MVDTGIEPERRAWVKPLFRVTGYVTLPLTFCRWMGFCATFKPYELGNMPRPTPIYPYMDSSGFASKKHFWL